MFIIKKSLLYTVYYLIFFLFYFSSNLAFSFVDSHHELYAVVYVFDGDTILVENDFGETMRVRLIAIDAPEKDQPYGDESRWALIDKIEDEDVHLKIYGKDVYERTLAQVFFDDQDVNRWMIEVGAAWYYPFSSHRSKFTAYQQAQKIAEKKGLGLWQDSEILEPWKWRDEADTEDDFLSVTHTIKEYFAKFQQWLISLFV